VSNASSSGGGNAVAALSALALANAAGAASASGNNPQGRFLHALHQVLYLYCSVPLYK